ncbi:MAG TPA: patatin-like phospholipase family protein [Solirubrobacterales bacterium]|jgi:NTE family protein|nr:patatin-like phospholipase family protein [Solirubrobacterales bacterium]
MADVRAKPPREEAKPNSPVRWIPADQKRGKPKSGIGLCLSGGGYRAMLFHVGALWRLNELGYLKQLTRVSSVSGGSIAAAVLGQRWRKLEFKGVGPEGHPVAANLEAEVVAPLRSLAASTLDVPAVLTGMLLPGTTISTRLAAAYRRHLFGGATLQDLPSDADGPRFVINATNLQSGVLWRFSRPYIADYRVGMISEPMVGLADAVAASSAFPPILAPARFRFAEDQYDPDSGEDLQTPPFTTRPTLADGGVYDNLGLETAWKSCKTVLVSDGGGAMEPDGGKFGPFKGYRWRDWGTQMVRVTTVIDNQVRSLRKQQTVAGYQAPEDSEEHRLGTYWGIRSDIANFELPTSMEAPYEETLKLARVATRLARLDAATQELLINWGYAICDAGMRKWVDEHLPTPPGFPYPNRPLTR